MGFDFNNTDVGLIGPMEGASVVRKKKDLIGQVFGRLTVISESEKKGGSRHWLCRCQCGNEKIFRGNNIVRGHTKSCGCFVVEMMTKHGNSFWPDGRRRYYSRDLKRKETSGLIKKVALSMSTGGLSSTREYKSWRSMLDRCYRQKSPKFNSYGGRGISVCELWRKSFKQFLSDMGPRPLNHSIDRIDNNGNYEPGNCRWADSKTQARNRRSNRKIWWNGENLCVVEVAERLGISHSSVVSKINSQSI